jgi:hypothetical protein
MLQNNGGNFKNLLKLTGSFGFDFAHHKFRHGLTRIYTRLRPDIRHRGYAEASCRYKNWIPAFAGMTKMRLLPATRGADAGLRIGFRVI